MACTGNSCEWKFDEALQINVCSDTTATVNCSLELALLIEPEDKIFIDLLAQIQENANTVLADVHSKCHEGHVVYSSFIMNPDCSKPKLEWSTTGSNSEFLGVDEDAPDLASKAEEITQFAQTKLSDLGSLGEWIPVFVVTGDCGIRLAWVCHDRDELC